MIRFKCPGCETKLSAKDELAGKRTKCPKCGTVVAVSAPTKQRLHKDVAGVPLLPEDEFETVEPRQFVETANDFNEADVTPPTPHSRSSKSTRSGTETLPSQSLEAGGNERLPIAPIKEKRMKLVIKRNQKAHTGVFGGHKGMIFLLECRVVLTAQEQQLIQKYKADQFLAEPPKIEGMKTNVACYTPSILMAGVTHECKDVIILLQTEAIIKEACRNFKILLDVMASFGGEEVIEF